MRTGGGIGSLGLLASAAITVAAPGPDVQLSPGGVLEAGKPLTIGVRGDRGRVFVQATLLPDEVIARLYSDAKFRRKGGALRSPVGPIPVPARGTVADLEREWWNGFVGAVDLRPLLGDKRGMALVEARRAVTATISAPVRGGLYRIRVVASAPLPAGAPGPFGSADAWLDVL
jgi:hypothetical protein